jgi:hypothetical protein
MAPFSFETIPFSADALSRAEPEAETDRQPFTQETEVGRYRAPRAPSPSRRTSQSSWKQRRLQPGPNKRPYFKRRAQLWPPYPFPVPHWRDDGVESVALDGRDRFEEPPGHIDVQWVQRCLNRALEVNLRPTGVMNPATRSALRSFQRGQGLPATGAVGPRTRSALTASCSEQPAPTFGFDAVDAQDEVAHGSPTCNCAACRRRTSRGFLNTETAEHETASGRNLPLRAASPQAPVPSHHPGTPSQGGRKRSTIARRIFDRLRDSYARRLQLGPGGQVHHAIELQVLDRYPGVFRAAELNDLSNMRGIGAELEGRRQLHNSKVREFWDRHYQNLDQQIVKRRLNPGTAPYNDFVRRYLGAARDEIDYLLGQFFSEYRSTMRWKKTRA